jgi:hypothetical protein
MVYGKKFDNTLIGGQISYVLQLHSIRAQSRDEKSRKFSISCVGFLLVPHCYVRPIERPAIQHFLIPSTLAMKKVQDTRRTARPDNFP